LLEALLFDTRTGFMGRIFESLFFDNLGGFNCLSSIAAFATFFGLNGF